MSLNICLDCNFEKKNCKCEILKLTKEVKIKISWWKRIFFWAR